MRSDFSLNKEQYQTRRYVYNIFARRVPDYGAVIWFIEKNIVKYEVGVVISMKEVYMS